MPAQDTSKLKENIIAILRKRGPSLPVHIANETGLSILFASAFLSELISERKIKISHMRIGSSPIYFLPNQEYLLEKFSSHLKSREKDAYILLKEKKFLIDSEQDPAIRVALRNIKDFAVNFQKQGKILWRYYTVPENEFKEKSKIINTQTKTIQINKPIIKSPESPSLLAEITPNKTEKIEIKQSTENTSESKSKKLNIFDKENKSPTEKKPNKKIQKKKKTPQKNNDKFFNKIKEFLTEKKIDILDIESFNKNDLILRIRIKNQEELLIAYNKKRIKEEDIIKAGKKAQELNLSFTILSLGEPLKKLKTLIKAVKNLSTIEKL